MGNSAISTDGVCQFLEEATDIASGTVFTNVKYYPLPGSNPTVYTPTQWRSRCKTGVHGLKSLLSIKLPTNQIVLFFGENHNESPRERLCKARTQNVFTLLRESYHTHTGHDLPVFIEDSPKYVFERIVESDFTSEHASGGTVIAAAAESGTSFAYDSRAMLTKVIIDQQSKFLAAKKAGENLFDQEFLLPISASIEHAARATLTTLQSVEHQSGVKIPCFVYDLLDMVFNICTQAAVTTYNIVEDEPFIKEMGRKFDILWTYHHLFSEVSSLGHVCAFRSPVSFVFAGSAHLQVLQYLLQHRWGQQRYTEAKTDVCSNVLGDIEVVSYVGDSLRENGTLPMHGSEENLSYPVLAQVFRETASSH